MILFVDKNRDLVDEVIILGIQALCDDYFQAAQKVKNPVLMTASNPLWTFGGGIDAEFRRRFPKIIEQKMRRQEWMERKGNICFCVTVDSNLKATKQTVKKALQFALRKTKNDETLLIHGAGTGIGGLSIHEFIDVLLEVTRLKNAAMELGKLGGKSSSPRKTAAVRQNGKLGGRPKNKI